MADNNVSVVTGGAGGMGIACSRRFAVSGDVVLLADIDPDRVATTAAELADEVNAEHPDAGEIVPVTLDVTDPAAVSGLADQVASRGRLRAVAHTAGLSPTMADAGTILNVNYVGSVRLLDALESLVVEDTAAVCVASQAGHLGAGEDPDVVAALADPLAEDYLARAEAAGITDPGMAYGWSKWLVRRLVVERAVTWGAKGARILSLSPGIIDTPMGRQELEQQPMMATIIEMTPLGRTGTADEIASVIEFLCSPGASFMTGVDVLVDGGSTEQLRGHMQALQG